MKRETISIGVVDMSVLTVVFSDGNGNN